jgi:FKBP-type peptidyl-prolyl cis-trans isomerase
MQKRLLAALVMAAAISFPVFAQDGDLSGDFSSDKDVSFAIGVLLAKSITDSGIIVDFPSFADGLRKSLVTGDPGITLEVAAQTVQRALDAAFNKQKEENLKKTSQFLLENGRKKGVQTTKSGLQYEIIERGGGAHPQKDSVVVVHYTGSLIDGTVFDSSRERDEPATIPLGQVIPGWSEGIQLMRVGGRSRFFIPPNLAYGEEDAIEEIPPNSVLIFDVELLEIEGE